MQRRTATLLAGLGAAFTIVAAISADAATCANGVYRAGCAGPNGAVAVKKPAASSTTCVKGVYRAGCTGPNGTAVATRPVAATPGVHCTYVNGARVCR